MQSFLQMSLSAGIWYRLGRLSSFYLQRRCWLQEFSVGFFMKSLVTWTLFAEGMSSLSLKYKLNMDIVRGLFTNGAIWSLFSYFHEHFFPVGSCKMCFYLRNIIREYCFFRNPLITWFKSVVVAIIIPQKMNLLIKKITDIGLREGERTFIPGSLIRCRHRT